MASVAQKKLLCGDLIVRIYLMKTGEKCYFWKLVIGVLVTIMSLPVCAAPQRFLLVSFSMPTSSLAAYCRATKNKNITLVLKGLVNNSLSDTAKKLSNENLQGCTWQVEPRYFTKFEVMHVPTLLAFDTPLAPGWSDTTPLPPHQKITGHVTLGALLAELTSEKNP